MTENERIGKAIGLMEELLRGNSGGHDPEHALRVLQNALRIADAEPECDRELVALAAVLHDADDHKLFQTKNNENARRILRAVGVEDARADAVIEAVNAVSFSQNRGKTPGTLEAAIVQDADRLDAIGAVGIARTFAYGGEHGRPLVSSVAHFHEKLLLLRDLMNTATGRMLADRRHAYLEGFLKELEEETGMK